MRGTAGIARAASPRDDEENVHHRLCEQAWSEQEVFSPDSRRGFLSLLDQDLSSPTRYQDYLALFDALVLVMWLERNRG